MLTHEAANRPVLLHPLSDATRRTTSDHRLSRPGKAVADRRLVNNPTGSSHLGSRWHNSPTACASQFPSQRLDDGNRDTAALGNPRNLVALFQQSTGPRRGLG